MKKWILSFFLIAALVLLVLGVVVWRQKEAMLEKALSKALQTPVHLSSIHLSQSGVELKDLSIASPDLDKEKALEVKNLRVLFSPWSLLKGPVVIDEVVLQGLNFRLDIYDLQAKKTNWGKILDGLEGEEKGRRIEDSQSSEKEQEKAYVLKLLRLEDVAFHVKHPVLGRTSTRVKELTFKDLDQKGAKSSKVLTSLVVKTLLSYIVKAPKFQTLTKELLHLPKNVLQEIFFFGKEAQTDSEEVGDESRIQESKPGLLKTFKKAGEFMKELTPFENK